MKSYWRTFLRVHWDAMLASVAGCLFLYYFTRHSGIGVSPDSVNYLSAANNIRDHFSFTDFNGMPLVDFPLGYPVFLAMASFAFKQPAIQIVPLLNCFLFSAVILLSSVIINGYQKTSPLYKTLFLAIVACSPCLLEVYSMVWSETLFLFLILLFMVAMRNYFKTHSILSLVWVSFVVAMAVVTRYAGISLLVTGGFLILFDAELGRAKKIKHILLFGILGSSLVAINLVRNKYAAGHITGVREKALRSLIDNFHQIGATIADWLPFVRGHEQPATLAFMVVLLFGIILLINRTIQQPFFQSYETIVTCFFVLYAFFILGIATISRFENLSGRLLSPMYIPLLLVGSSWVISYLQNSIRLKRSMLLILVLILYAGFQYNHYQLNADAWEGIKDAGIPGYTEDSWTQSPAVAFIKKNKNKYRAPVFANANDAVYFLTGIHAMPLPHKEIQQEIDACLQHPSFYLIWFTDGENPDLINLAFIKQHKTLVSVEELEGGAVYYFSGSH
jgi:hypothetical protein